MLDLSIVSTLLSISLPTSLVSLILQPLENVYKVQVRKQFQDVFVKYEQRELSWQAAKATIEADQQHKDSDYDSESDLFKARGISEVESEYIKWMKQQPMKRDTSIFKY